MKSLPQFSASRQRTLQGHSQSDGVRSYANVAGTLGLAVALSAIAGSNFALNALQVGGRYVPEPLLIVWLICAIWIMPESLRAFRSAVGSVGFRVLVGVVLLSLAIARTRGTGLTVAYGDARATLLLGLAFGFVSYKWEGRRQWELFIVTFFLATCVLDVIRPRVFGASFDADVVKLEMSFLAPIGLAWLGLKRRSLLLIGLSMVFSVQIARAGFFRVYYIGPISIAAMACIVATSEIRRGALGGRFGLTLLAMLFAGGFLLTQKWGALVDGLSETATKRVHAVERTSKLIEGVMRGDLSVESERIDSLRVAFARPGDLLVPYGVGWRDSLSEVASRFGSDTTIVSTMDSGYLYIAFHHGVFVLYSACMLAVVYAWRGMTTARQTGHHWLFLIAILVLGLDMLVEAGMFTIVPRAVQFGTLAGLIFAAPRLPIRPFPRRHQSILAEKAAEHCRLARMKMR